MWPQTNSTGGGGGGIATGLIPPPPLFFRALGEAVGDEPSGVVEQVQAAPARLVDPRGEADLEARELDDGDVGEARVGGARGRRRRPGEDVAEVLDERAIIKLRLRSRRQTIFLIKNDGDWMIDVLSGINAGLSDEARKVQESSTKDKTKKEKEKELFTEPKKEGWWKE